mgnify:FL=1
MQDKMMKFLRYLYPTDEIQDFMINDFYQELGEIIPKTKCFSSENIVNVTRKNNYNYVKTSIIEFLNTNPTYQKELQKLLKRPANDMVEEFIIGYVFYVVNTDKNNACVDIFKNKKSICYTSSPTILDIL